jgi:Spy/CpxP family protein refolding chaperone
MNRVRRSLVLGMAFVLGATLVTAAEAQAAAAGGTRRGPMAMVGQRASLVALLNLEAVQKELKLTEEQVGKVREATKNLRAEMREQRAALREITSPQERRAKATALSAELDRKARQALRDVLSREQWMRLFQIRIQVGGTLAALTNPRIAARLKLTDEQNQKVAEIQKTVQEKTSAIRRGLRNLSQQERTERLAEARKLGQKAEQDALAVLTADQKEAFNKMKGEPFKLPRRGRGA